jgi:hypothetical protein
MGREPAADALKPTKHALDDWARTAGHPAELAMPLAGGEPMDVRGQNNAEGRKQILETDIGARPLGKHLETSLN